MNTARCLVIVQDVPTQFDVPLYNELARSAPFRLTVIYTQTRQPGSGIDPELGHAPQWDHVVREDYARIDLTPAQARRPREVVALILEQQPDLVLISGYYPLLHHRLVRPLRQRGLRVGLRSDNTLAHSDFRGLKGLVKRLVLPRWLRGYSSWHPVGSLAQAYLEQVAHTTRPTYLFPYAVDNDWFARESAPQRAGRAAALKHLGFPADSYVVLGILKWHAREDPLLLLRAFRQLLLLRPDARLILVGDGPLRAKVEGMIAGMADKVSTPGYVAYSQLPRLYALADIFVHPAPGEPWGVSVNEALTCAVPVAVSSGVGAGADLVDDGLTGFVFPAGDWQALAERLFAFSQREDTAAIRAACATKIRYWHYDGTRAAFERALGAAP